MLYQRTTLVAHPGWSNDGSFESSVVKGVVGGVVVVKKFRDIPLLVLGVCVGTEEKLSE